MRPASTTYFSLYFRKDNEATIYVRRVQTIFDLLSYVGGFYKALFSLGYIFSSVFGYHIFVSSIMKRLYYFEDEKNDCKDS